jgi:sorting nexin-29
LNSVWNKEELLVQLKDSIIVPVHIKKGNKIDCNNYCGISLLPTSYKILLNILLSRLSLYIDEIIGDHNCFYVADQLLIRFSAFVRYLREKNGSTMRQYFSYSEFKKAFDSVRREVLYNILIKFGSSYETSPIN